MTKERRSPVWETEGFLYLSYRVHTGLVSCQPSLNSLHSPLKGDWRSFLSVALIQPWPKATSRRRGLLCLVCPSHRPSVKELKAGSQGRHLKTGLRCCSHKGRCVEQVCGAGVLVCMQTCTWRPGINLGHYHVPSTLFFETSFSVAWNSQLGLAGHKPQRACCLYQPLRLGVHATTPGFRWVPGVELWSSLLCTEHFIKCTVSSSPVLFFVSQDLRTAQIVFRLYSQGYPWFLDPPFSTECWDYRHTPSTSCILDLISTVSHSGFFLSEHSSNDSFFSSIITDFLCLPLVTTFW